MIETYKRPIFLLMILAMAFGFFHLFFPAGRIPFDFERLHIFLFNLCAGGTLILLHTRREDPPSPVIPLFLVVSVLFAISAFFAFYIPAMVLALFLAAIVESQRIRVFSFFPRGFFDPREPVARKFHQASLLCLSMGLAISALVMLNNTYTHWVTMEKLVLNTFFLGFSFPVSLITMSVMFQLIGDNRIRSTRVLKNVGFWAVNLGVILFFLFILFECMLPQLVISLTLFVAVCLIFFLFLRDRYQAQQKSFLSSGMVFLVFTGISGIAYILLEMTPWYDAMRGTVLLKLHSFASLYGWNLSGLAVIVRYDDFPIRLHSRTLIFIHWLTVLFFAPLGYYSQPFAAIATISYIVLLEIIFFSAKGGRSPLYPKTPHHPAS